MNPPVLMIGNFLSASGGTLCVCEELSQKLSEAGWSVLTASHQPGALHRLWGMLSAVYRQRNRYAVAHVEVYHHRAFFWAEASCAALRCLHKPYVLTLHGGQLPQFAARWPRRTRSLLGSAAVVTVPSGYFERVMSPYCPDLRVLPNAIELRAHPFRLRAPARPLLVWLRAFRKIYNPVMALQSLRLLTREFPDIALTMIGADKGDGTRQRTERAATELDVAGRVTIQRAVPKSQVPGCLAQGDVYLNTTNGDNTPVTVLEAMACGLCVVSTDVGGMSYLIEHEQDGLLVPSNDPPAMAAAVRRILTDPSLARRLSANARAKVVQYDWRLILPQWEALLMIVAKSAQRKELVTSCRLDKVSHGVK
jgi:glycosyltransferase involved in cell wall biosynthesis